MKAGEVLKLLRISRPTLTKYVKAGMIQELDSHCYSMKLYSSRKKKKIIELIEEIEEETR